MRVTQETAERVLEIIQNNFRVDVNDANRKYYFQTITCKKKYDLAGLDAPGINFWNVWHDKPPFFEYAGKDDSMTPRVAAANNALRDLFAPKA